jgi:uncharacterized membrane protein YphA (DoxX/SURF4 family)
LLLQELIIPLQRPFSRYPVGWPGIGLGILRLVASSSSAFRGVRFLASAKSHGSPFWLLGLAEVCLGTGIALGILTPVFSAFAAATFIYSAIPAIASQACDLGMNSLAVIPMVSIPLALVFTGPGAYSLDAWLFGRREIVISVGTDADR